MGDHGHHDPGGHELEAINTKLLFRLLISLSFVTLLASIAVVQWFNSQRRELQQRYAEEGSVFLQQYQAGMDEGLAGVDQVASDVAANPALLAAPPPPSGWIHPDDLVGGPAPKPAPEQAPEPEEEPIPVEAPGGEDDDDDPDNEDAEGDAPAEDDAPADDAGDAGDDAGDVAPKQPKPEPKQPKPKPADDGGDAAE